MTDDLTALAHELDATPPEVFARWEKDFPLYAPVLDRWKAAMAERQRLNDQNGEFYSRLLAREAPPLNLENIANADLQATAGYATFIQRGERFCDGHIGACHERGLLAAVARRFAELEARP